MGGIGLWTGQRFVGFQFKFGNFLETAERFFPENNYQLLELPE